MYLLEKMHCTLGATSSLNQKSTYNCKEFESTYFNSRTSKFSKTKLENKNN